MKEELLYADLTYKIIGCAMKVHSTLGNGFLEKVYENSLVILLNRQGIKAVHQVPIKVWFESVVVGDYFADILVEDKIILELKVAERISEVHKAQTLNYIKATKLELALILNFGARSLENFRLINKFEKKYLSEINEV